MPRLRPPFSLLTLCIVLALTPSLWGAELSEITSLRVEPERVELQGPNASRGVLVHGVRSDGRLMDLTRQASYSTEAATFRVDDTGVITAVSDGDGAVLVRIGDQSASVAVRVQRTGVPRRYHFENDVVPILSKFGCNSSGCHGKAEGQNGFKLSVFGFDPRADYDALSKEGRGRRAFPLAPDRSLLLTKASGGTPHGGGVRIPRDSREYQVLRGWIATGMPLGADDAPTVERIVITPQERVVDPNGQQQLRVMAHYTDGRAVDVTQIAKYQSNVDGLAKVDEQGLVRIGPSPGQVAIMATYMGAVDTFRALIPRKQTTESPGKTFVEHNFIDKHVHDQLRKLNIRPSGPASDSEFLRRVCLDITGSLPTARRARAFLADKRPDKRRRLVDELLEEPAYADYWALKWSDTLRVDRQSLGHKNALAFYNWIHSSLRRNQPYDRFVAELVTASGSLKEAPQANFYRVVSSPGEMSSTISQVFLGVRIACAECHHHPFDRWSQSDYFGMTAFFQQVSRKGAGPRGEHLFATGDPATKHPRSGKPIFAHALAEPMPEKSPTGDRREVLAAWMTDPANRWFSQNAANRLWAHFMGRGLVEPVDDFRDTNPPTNPALLEALAQHFVDVEFDIKQLIRTITASRAYQRTSEPNATNEQDEQNYSRALFKRMEAEVLMDALCQVTGVDEKFTGVPHGYRAIQLWDSQVDHYFLKLFGRPMRKTACECERSIEPNVGQVLHVLNSPEIHDKLAHERGYVANLVKREADIDTLTEELYLTYFARLPDADERATAARYIGRAAADKRKSVEDLAWSLMNSLEFVFNH